MGTAATWSRGVALAALVVTLAPLSWPQDQATSKVRILLVGSLGDEVYSPVEVTITNNGRFVNAQRVTKAISLTLPFGDYQIECKAGSLIAQKRVVRVRTPEMDVVVGLALKDPSQIIGEGTPAQWLISGRVQAGGSERVIVKVVGVFLNTAIEKSVRPGDSFAISVDEQGKYLLLMTRGDKLVVQKEVQVQIGGPSKIELGLLAEGTK